MPAETSTAHHLRTTCRACGGGSLDRFLELGPTPLANSFLTTADQPEHAYPLDVYLCQRCSLVQLLDVIDPEVLFRDYIYVSGTSATMRRHFQEYADTVTARLALAPGDLVVEAASNDGTLLRSFHHHGVRTLGVEPARNVAALAREQGVETLAEFFNLPMARRLRSSHGGARAVIGNNVLAHVDDPLDFLRGAAELAAAADGWVIVEAPYLGEMLRRLEYDTIYHEHLCYFSVTSLMRLFEGAGLRIQDVEPVSVHGGSLRVFAQPESCQPRHGDGVLAWAAREAAEGMTSLARYQQFAADVAGNRAKLRETLYSLRDQGLRLAAYGAPAKGNTLLNYCGLGAGLLDFTVDKSPHKVGRFTPGQRLPVLAAEALLERQPGCVLMLAWNFAEEILREQQAYRDRGGKFLLPVPSPRLM